MHKKIFQGDSAIKKIKADDAMETGRDVKSTSQRRLVCKTIFADTWTVGRSYPG